MAPLLSGDEVTEESLQAAIKRVKRAVPVVSTKDADALTVNTFGAVDAFNRRDFQRTTGLPVPELRTDAKVNVPEFATKLGEQWRRDHIALIKSLGERAKERVVDLLRDASQKSTRVETLRGQLQNEFGVGKRRAQLIAQDQILTLSAKLRRSRHERAGITQYKWRTVDAAARENHKKLDGKIFSYDDPPLGGGTGPDDHGNPGDGIRCRCQDIPVIPEFAVQKRTPTVPSALTTPKGKTQPQQAPQTKGLAVLSAKQLALLADHVASDLAKVAGGQESGATRAVFRARMAAHGVTFSGRNKGIFSNPKLKPHQMGGAHINPRDPLHGKISLNPTVALAAQRELARAKATGNFEPAHDHLVTLMHEETHFAASADAMSYWASPEHAWVEEVATELAAQRLTSGWVGTRPLSVGGGAISRTIAYQKTALETVEIVSGVLGVSEQQALDLITEAGLAMRRPGAQNRTYLQAFLDGFTVPQGKKDEIARRIRIAAAAKVPGGEKFPHLDAEGAEARSWSAPLWDMLRGGKYPSEADVERVVSDAARRGLKSVPAAEAYNLGMATGFVSNEVLSKYGVKIIDDGVIRR